MYPLNVMPMDSLATPTCSCIYRSDQLLRKSELSFEVLIITEKENIWISK